MLPESSLCLLLNEVLSASIGSKTLGQGVRLRDILGEFSCVSPAKSSQHEQHSPQLLSSRHKQDLWGINALGVNAVLISILGGRVRGCGGHVVRDALATHEEHALQDSGGSTQSCVGGRYPPPSPWMGRSL